jgi:thiol-disulfide isomerase/thioredoxin
MPLTPIRPSSPSWPQRWLARWKSHLGTLLLMLAVFWAVQAWQTRHLAAMPDLQAPVQWLDSQGQPQTGTLHEALAAINPSGGPIALYVWAEWCAICTAQQSTVQRLQQDWPALTVAMQSGDAAQVGRYLRQRELAWATVIDSRAEWAHAQGVRSVPAFAVLDPQGRLRHPTVGYTSGWGMRARLWAARLF